MAVSGPPKKAAIDLDEMGDRRLSEMTAAEFVQCLEQAAGAPHPVAADDLTLREVLAGARPIRLPEKKKVELEKSPVEGFPEKKKVELENSPVEGFPEKKKVELEKSPVEGFPEKKKVELEKP